MIAECPHCKKEIEFKIINKPIEEMSEADQEKAIMLEAVREGSL